MFAMMRRLYEVVQNNDMLEGYRTLLYHQGLWPEPNDAPSPGDTASRWRAVRRRWHGLVVCGTPLLFLLLVYPATLIARHDELMTVVDVVSYAFALALIASKLCSVRLRGERVRTLCAQLEALCRRAQPVAQADGCARQEATQRTLRRMLVAFLAVMSANTVLGFAFIPELRAKREFYSSAWFPYEWRLSPWYELTLAVWAISWSVMAFAQFSVDALFMAMLVLLASALRELRVDIANIGHARPCSGQVESPRSGHDRVPSERDRQYSGSVRVSSGCVRPASCPDRASPCDESAVPDHGDMERSLVECAQRFQESIRLAGEIEGAFQWVLQLQLACSVVPSVLVVVWATTAEGLQSKANVLLGAAAVCWLNLLVICHLAGEITQQSALVREAVFECAWLRASDAFKRSMRIIMSRSNGPVEITVAGFVPLTRDTFLRMGQLVYSYLMGVREIVKT